MSDSCKVYAQEKKERKKEKDVFLFFDHDRYIENWIFSDILGFELSPAQQLMKSHIKMNLGHTLEWEPIGLLPTTVET